MDIYNVLVINVVIVIYIGSYSPVHIIFMYNICRQIFVMRLVLNPMCDSPHAEVVVLLREIPPDTEGHQLLVSVDLQILTTGTLASNLVVSLSATPDTATGKQLLT